MIGGSPGRSCPKSQLSAPLTASNVPHDETTPFAETPGATGGFMTNLVCVKTEPLLAFWFVKVARYAMFSPYVTAPGPGTASNVTFAIAVVVPRASPGDGDRRRADQSQARDHQTPTRMSHVSPSLSLPQRHVPHAPGRIVSDGRLLLQATTQATRCVSVDRARMRGPGRRGRVVRQRPAKPRTAVRIRSAPLALVLQGFFYGLSGTFCEPR